METYNYLKLLKLASHFTDKKNFRLSSKVVNVRREERNTIIEATEGHIAIQVYIKEIGMNPDYVDCKQYTVDSILKSNKVGIDLLETIEDNCIFPTLNQLFNDDHAGSNYAAFDLYLFTKVTKALSELFKSLKVKLPILQLTNLSNNGVTTLALSYSENVRIRIAIIHLKK